MIHVEPTGIPKTAPPQPSRVWHGPIRWQACQRADNHVHSWMRRDGTVMCEDCARIEAGWDTCRHPTCTMLTPPNGTRPGLCDEHQATGVVCDVCDGIGDIECTERNCHGQYCDMGVTECADCFGTGMIGQPVTAP